MSVIDLRSDTVTLPSPEMRQAMFEAELGDDVFGEDPTINRLEETAADRIGTEAALFVPSGTMANLISALTHCNRGDEVILGNQAHMFRYEAGGIAALGSIHPHTLPNLPDGTIELKDIVTAIRGDDVHYPRTRLICLENTHNRCGGAVLLPEYISEVVLLAKKHGLLLHLDGARIFNAAAALGIDVRVLTKGFDSVSFCLSKGLSAPVGSVVCGSKHFIAEARRNRKLLGGGMRQAGVLAAAGIVAIEKMVDRLAEDHANTQRLAEGIMQIEGLATDTAGPQSNMVYFSLACDKLSGDELVSLMDKRNVKFLQISPNRFRMVTHYGIDESDIDVVIAELTDVLNR